MTLEDQQALTSHTRAMAEILHRNAAKENIQTLEGIEVTVRNQLIEYVNPEVALFLWKQRQGKQKVELEK
jgi:hypothetical protein